MKLFSKDQYPFARFLTAFFIGIILADHFSASEKTFYWLQVVCLASVSMFCLLCCCLGWARRRWYPIYGLLFSIFLLLAGWTKYWEDDPRVNLNHFSCMKADALLAYVADEPVRTGKQLRFPIQVTMRFGKQESSDATGRLSVTLQIEDAKSHPQLKYGDEFILPATFHPVPPAYNPGEMDYKIFLRHQHIWHQAYFKESQIQKTGGKHGNWLISKALLCRELLVKKLNSYLKDPDARAMMAALLLGYRANMDRDLQNAYAATGTIHILSVSGMHVAIIFWLLIKLLGWMGPRLKWLRYVLLMSAIWGFAILTGLAPSALRAALMLSFVMTAIVLEKQAQIYNSIAASAFMLLWADPGYAFDIGFQLSYLAVWGIIYFYPRIRQLWRPSWYGWRWMWDYTALSVAAQLGAFPLAMYYFHQFPMYFLPANLLVDLPVTGMMWLGIGLLLCPWEPVNHLTGFLLEKIIAFTNRIIYMFEGLPHASLQGIWLYKWQYAVIYLLLLALFTGIRWHSQKGYLLSLCLLCLLSITSAGRKITAWRQREICIFNMRSHLAIGLYSSQTSLIYSDIPSLDDRRIQYSVWPESSRHCRSEQLTHVPVNGSWRGNDLLIRGGLIQFGDQRMMVYDGKHTYHQHLELDILLLRSNPKEPLRMILEKINCRQLLADASNNTQTIKRLQQEAKNLHVPFYLLKDNFAYVWKF